MSTRKTPVVDTQYMPESKENQFQTIVKAFENQQWAKGLKLVEPLLKEFPENGKLISMKSILKYNIDKNADEAEIGLKRGMMLGRRTSLCWHLYGIFQRSQKKYGEAKKAFQLAYSLDPLNIQILVDLSDLQIQVRDYAGYRISKQKLMNERSGNNTFWVGFIMGAYLEKKYDLCIEIISSYLPSLEQKACYPVQELLFLEADCYACLKKWDEAIETIQNGMKLVLNENRAFEMLAVYYLQKEEFEKCRSTLSKLIEMNCDSKYYFILLECLLLKRTDLVQSAELPSFTISLSPPERDLLLRTYHDLFTTYPKSIYLPIVLLNLMEGEDFITFLTSRVYNAIRKGIPSFFQSLLPVLNRNPSKMEMLKSICLKASQNLKETNMLEDQEEEPFVLLWLTLILAEIADYEVRYDEALQYVDAAIRHTPTCYDAYLLKSKICKHAGYLEQSEAMMEFGYSLDKFDRYMNTKCVKTCLTACHIEKADEIVSYWTRSNVPCRIDLETLEACWYELRCGTAYLRRKDFPHALKLYNNVLKHFETFIAEQFDFHGYVLRKSILTSYASFLHSLDSLYNHRYFKTAAIGALKCAIAVFDTPFKEEEYVKHFSLTKTTVHKKGAEYTDDKDPDGLQFIQNPKLFDSLQTTVTQLLQFAKNDREAMRWVFEWGKRKNNTTLCEEAIENLKTHCHAVSDAAYYSSLLHPEDSREMPFDSSSIHDRVLQAKLLLLQSPSASVYEVIAKDWNAVNRSNLEEFVECYEILRQNDADKLLDFVHLAQSFYPGFEETIHCWIHYYCLLIIN